MRPHLRAALLALGSATVLSAVAWWWITFGDVIRFGYLSWHEAGGCLVQNSDICSLAKALCLGSHPRNFFAYGSGAFWASAALFSVGVVWNATHTHTKGSS